MAALKYDDAQPFLKEGKGVIIYKQHSATEFPRYETLNEFFDDWLLTRDFSVHLLRLVKETGIKTELVGKG